MAKSPCLLVQELVFKEAKGSVLKVDMDIMVLLLHDGRSERRPNG